MPFAAAAVAAGVLWVAAALAAAVGLAAASGTLEGYSWSADVPDNHLLNRDKDSPVTVHPLPFKN